MRSSAFIGTAAAAVLAATLQGSQPLAFSAPPKLPLPPHVKAQNKRQQRRLLVKERNKAERRAICRGRQLSNHKDRVHYREHSPEEQRRFATLVNKMTNSERNGWARAGYPGLRNKEVDELLPYAQAAQRRLDGTFLSLSDGRVYPK